MKSRECRVQSKLELAKQFTRRVSVPSLLILASVAPGWVLAQVQGVMLDKPELIPQFELSNASDEDFNQDFLQGQWTLIMFGFISCPDVCPFTLKNLEAAYSETAMRVHPDSVPKVIFVSVDPERDATHVSNFASFFHPAFQGFTGDLDNIGVLIESTDSFYRLMKPDSTGFYDVQHSASVSVVNPEGMLVAKLQPPFDPGKTAEFIARLQISYRREKKS